MKNLLCKTTLFLTICFMLISSNALYAGDEHYELPLQANESLYIPILPKKKAYIKIKDGYLIVDFGKENTQSIENVEDMLKQDIIRFYVEIADFNFDKMLDIAIPVTIGYGGLNVFCDIFFFDKKSGYFKKVLSEISNFDLDKKKKEITSEMTSTYCCHYYKRYRFFNGKPYEYFESVVANLCVEKITLKKPNGKIIKTAVGDYNEEKNALEPDVRAITKDRVYFYDKPDEKARTEMYVVKGDKVTLLDLSGEWYEWILVRYKGKKHIEKWIKFDDLCSDVAP